MPLAATSGQAGDTAPIVLPFLAGSLGPRKVMVYVHGAGRFDPGYEQPMVTQIQNRLAGQPVQVIAVRYADVVDPSSPGMALYSASNADALEKFQEDFQKEIARDAFLRAFSAISTEQLLSVLGTAALPGGTNLLTLVPALLRSTQGTWSQPNILGQLQRVFPGVPIADWLGKLTSGSAMGGLPLDMVAKQVWYYLFNDQVRAVVQGRLKSSLETAMQEFDDIVLVSHSLGSLVAFDVLHDCADAVNRVSYWVTMGCPLAKVQRLGNRGDLGHIGYQTIRRWYNIYDTTDIVSNALGPLFPSMNYILYDIFVDVAKDPLPAHDYMTNPETLDILAAIMK
ncbi:MAG TPA: hypothetical protein VF932_09755 [Anaerolineae bacterium]